MAARSLLRTLVGALALALASPALITPSSAATVVRLDLPQLVEEADLILLATVEATESFRAGRRIMTRVTLKPGTVVKGSADARVVVVVPGGSIGGIGQRVPGAASFIAGEDVVAFLSAAGPDGPRSVVGMAQGKLRVVPGLDGVRLVRDLEGLTLVVPDADGRLTPGGAAPASVPVDAFIAAIARMAAEPARLDPGAVDPAAPPGPAPHPTAPAGDVKP
ncbi:MAG: hypothetical protein R3F65_32550 [bacterium]